MGYLGAIIAKRYIKEFMARMLGTDEDKVFVSLCRSPSLRELENSLHDEMKSVRSWMWWYRWLKDHPQKSDLREEMTPIEKKLKNIVEALGEVPTIDIIAVYCPHFRTKPMGQSTSLMVSYPSYKLWVNEVVGENELVRKSCEFYEHCKHDCPYSEDLELVFAEVKTTRSKGEYEITKRQRRVLSDLKKLGYKTYLVIVKFEGSLQKPTASLSVYDV